MNMHDEYSVEEEMVDRLNLLRDNQYCIRKGGHVEII